jgi:hypothetical protein
MGSRFVALDWPAQGHRPRPNERATTGRGNANLPARMAARHGLRLRDPNRPELGWVMDEDPKRRRD